MFPELLCVLKSFTVFTFDQEYSSVRIKFKVDNLRIQLRILKLLFVSLQTFFSIVFQKADGSLSCSNVYGLFSLKHLESSLHPLGFEMSLLWQESFFPPSLLALSWEVGGQDSVPFNGRIVHCRLLSLLHFLSGLILSPGIPILEVQVSWLEFVHYFSV